MYIAGLDLTIHHTQGIEGLITASTLGTFIHIARQARRHQLAAEASAGKLVIKPKGLIGNLITPIHGFAIVIPPLAYVVGVAFNGFEQPEWIQDTRLPDSWTNSLGLMGKELIRTAAAASLFVMPRLLTSIHKHLGSQFAHIGVREKAHVVTTGPFAYVRHPMYSLAIVQTVIYSAAFWSWAPLVSTAVVGAAFAIKMPMEEKLIEEDDVVGYEYKEYKKKVRSRIIPYVW